MELRVVLVRDGGRKWESVFVSYVPLQVVLSRDGGRKWEGLYVSYSIV